jgi:hypothetical protein
LIVNVSRIISIQTHTAELNGSSINGVIRRHDNSFLLLEDAALEASRTTL